MTSIFPLPFNSLILCLLKKKVLRQLDVMVHVFSCSSQETEAGGLLRVSGQPVQKKKKLGRGGLVIKRTCCSSRAPPWWLTTVCNSSPRGSSSMGTRHAHGKDIHGGKSHIHIKIDNRCAPPPPGRFLVKSCCVQGFASCLCHQIAY